MISLNNPKYKMSVEDMKMIVGGKRVYAYTVCYYKSCATPENPTCREPDYTMHWYRIIKHGKEVGMESERDEFKN